MLRSDAVSYGLNIGILERGGRLCEVGFAQNEMPRLRNKRGFMESVGVESTDEIDCRDRAFVDSKSADNYARLQKLFPGALDDPPIDSRAPA